MASSVERPGEAGLEPVVRAYLQVSARFAADLLQGDLPETIAEACEVLAAVLDGGGKILFCGNGGSAADAQHFAAELVGSSARLGRPMAGLALTTDTSVLTALANDHGFQEIFARQVAALGEEGDALVAISTSGGSDNVVRAARMARERSMRVVALVGPSPSPLADLADVCLHVPGTNSSFIQQGHIAVGHLLCTILNETAAK